MHQVSSMRIALLFAPFGLMVEGCSCVPPTPIPGVDSGPQIDSDGGDSGDAGPDDGGSDQDDGGMGDGGSMDAGSAPPPDGGPQDAGAGADGGDDGGSPLEACIWHLGEEVALGAGLHFNLTWSTADDDLDLRVTRPGYDLCANGTNGRDVDDTNGYGPENIPVTNPTDGVYAAWVHLFEGAASTATLLVFAEGADTLVATCTLPLSEHQLWQAVSITVDGDSAKLTEPGVVENDFSCSDEP